MHQEGNSSGKLCHFLKEEDRTKSLSTYLTTRSLPLMYPLKVVAIGFHNGTGHRPSECQQ